jgi:hypothetical protein
MIGDKIRAAADAVDQAMQHHANAIDAHDRGETRKVALEHAHVTRCLRSAQRCFRDIAAEAGEQDLVNSKTIQTSSGTDVSGGSDNGRSGSPLYSRGNAGIKDWLDRARVGAGHR